MWKGINRCVDREAGTAVDTDPFLSVENPHGINSFCKVVGRGMPEDMVLFRLQVRFPLTAAVHRASTSRLLPVTDLTV